MIQETHDNTPVAISFGENEVENINTRATPPPPVQRVRFDDEDRSTISVRPISNSSDESGVSLSSAPDTEVVSMNNHKEITSYNIVGKIL